MTSALHKPGRRGKENGADTRSLVIGFSPTMRSTFHSPRFRLGAGYQECDSATAPVCARLAYASRSRSRFSDDHDELAGQLHGLALSAASHSTNPPSVVSTTTPATSSSPSTSKA